MVFFYRRLLFINSKEQKDDQSKINWWYGSESVEWGVCPILSSLPLHSPPGQGDFHQLLLLFPLWCWVSTLWNCDFFFSGNSLKFHRSQARVPSHHHQPTPLCPSVRSHPLLSGLGWQKGKYGNVSYIEADGQSKHWKSNVRLFPNEELALVLLAYTDRSREADRWLRIVEAQFISKYVILLTTTSHAFHQLLRSYHPLKRTSPSSTTAFQVLSVCWRC